jgi:hypothetical protein
MNLPVGAGYQLDAIRHDVCGCDWEFGYFQIDGYANDSSIPGISHMRTDVNDVGYTVTDATARYTSAIYSGEFNVRHHWTDAVTFLAGFRMGQLNEHYLAGGADAQLPLRNDMLAIGTSNHLYGFQLGADMNVYDMGGPLVIDVLCKAGVYGNNAHQNYSRIVVDNGVAALDADSAASRNQAAFLGEAGVVATYAITKRLAFRTSAKAMWLTGVALAPEQIEAINFRTSDYSLNTSGAVFYYGGGMGLEYRY